MLRTFKFYINKGNLEGLCPVENSEQGQWMPRRLFWKRINVLFIVYFCLGIYNFYFDTVTANWLKSQNGTLFRTCEDGAGWHLIPYRISPRSEFFSQAYKTWHITWGINLGPDWPPLARGSKFHTIHTPTRPLNFPPPRQQKIWTYRF